MYKIKTYNKIAETGLDIMRRGGFSVSDTEKEADAFVIRSQSLHDIDFPPTLRAIGRAGAGVNNVPVEKCTDKGIVVFNTPGANANAVKELVFSSLFLSGRDILGGIQYVKELKSKPAKEIHALVEKGKSNFKGFEVRGKRFGVIGLGAIGVLVANDASKLGMDITGFDPFISVDRAWGLSMSVKPAKNLNSLLSQSDFITLHMPLTEDTRHFINEEKIKKMKEGVTIFNFARPEIVDEDAIIEGLKSGSIRSYFTDFPTKKLIGLKNVIATPHLGASTKEAESNCAVMIANQIQDFLKNGNIKNSVNFPECILERSGKCRLIIANKNVPNVVGQITSILASHQMNILEMLNKSKDDLAYNIVDIDAKCSAKVISELEALDNIIFVRTC